MVAAYVTNNLFPYLAVPNKPRPNVLSIFTTLSTHPFTFPLYIHVFPYFAVPNKPRPNVTNTFSAHVQCVIMNKNRTTDIHEWFDETLNEGRVRQLQEGIQLDAWYSYNTNEFIAYVPGGGESTDVKGGLSQKLLF